MEIREMKLADVFTVAELESGIFSDAWSVSACRGAIDNKNIFPFVACDEPGGKIIGYAFLMGAADEAEILRIAVAKEYRRMGVADALMEKMIRYGSDDGYCFFYLEVRAGNEPAVSLYQKWGFNPAGQRFDYYKNPPEDALIMEMALEE
ncbi:MAG: ribosomal protein S18-alanine N-acetyltransferase [Lachnospiraceae bacterium]|nr:ribosomal protein S18-alanine N-acetyltransferase [Lachnospiraceae bacterium]